MVRARDRRDAAHGAQASPRLPEAAKADFCGKADAFANWIREHGTLAKDPATPPSVGSRDPDDDYLLALAIDRRAYLVSGDQDLLVLSEDFPILTPAQFLAKLGETR